MKIVFILAAMVPEPDYKQCPLFTRGDLIKSNILNDQNFKLVCFDLTLIPYCSSNQRV